tara:strand:+ start:14 stop:352 length:339 start_codon:yes stop_codon:yes gene_type:complete
MFKTKFIISSLVFVSFLLITSMVKNKTRVIEKQILNLNSKIILKEKNLNEAELDFHYLSSPYVVEERIKILGLNNYQPIPYSKIYNNFNEFNSLDNIISDLQNLNEKKIQKK